MNMKNGGIYPSRCVFYQKCPFAEEICKKKEPEMVELGNGHWVACHFV
jgi:oligopeptide/dipeptide ABC transporter ATP-binding protein